MVEMAMVVAILGIVLAMAFAFVISLQKTADTSFNRSLGTDQARLAVDQIDREVRSGNLLYDPAQEPAGAAGAAGTGYSMRVYTQANGLERCVQWRVLGAQMQTRSWSESWQQDGIVSAWRTVADHVVNAAPGPAPFSLDGNAGYGGRLLDVDLFVNENPSLGNAIEVKASVTGRNTEYGYNNSVCNSIPTP